MLWCMEVATILLITSCVAAGVVSAIVVTWRLRSDLYSFGDRLSVVEGIQTREVKIRAGAERGRRLSADEEALKVAIEHPPASQTRRLNFWETEHVKKLPRSA
jgi:hypothetical protein